MQVTARPVISGVHRARRSLASTVGSVTRGVSTAWRGERSPVRSLGAGGARSSVESFWSANTVKPLRLWTARASRRQLEWRLEQYPLFREFSDLWGDHNGEGVLDYGCGMHAGIGGIYRLRRGD